ncbi:MAG: chemotaxis protein CheW [Cyanobacteria bacterium P01_E01_bin.48]
MSATPLASLPSSERSATVAPKAAGQPYLNLRLDDRTSALIAMESAQEALVVNAQQITPMPNMPASVLGLLNRRSRVMWVVDLLQLLQLQPVATAGQQYEVVVLRMGSAEGAERALMGAVVRGVRGVVRIESEDIQSPIGHFPASLTPYLQGCVLYQQELLLVLDAEAIARSPLLRSS